MTRLYLAAALAAAAATVLAGAYATGRYHGYQKGRVAQMEDTIDAYRQRQEVEDEIDGMDDFAVCVSLGGVPDECEQLRGVDAAATGE